MRSKAIPRIPSASALAAAVLLLAGAALAQSVPTTINYQGRVLDSSGAGYHGTGYFKFAICDQAGSTTYWSNDLSSAGCAEPLSAIAVNVQGGLYDILLGGDTTGRNEPVPPAAFNNADPYLYIWFGSSAGSLEAMAPPQPLTSVAYSMRSEYASDAGTLGGLSPAQLKEPAAIVVDPSGNGDAATIGGGLGLALASGGPALIKVSPGNYGEAGLSVPPDTTLRCQVARACVIDAGGSDLFALGGSDNVRIEGFTLANFNNAIIFAGGEQNTVVADNYLVQGVTGLSIKNPSGAVSNLLVEQNIFDQFVDASEAKGILAAGSLGGTVSGLQVRDNIFQGFNSADLWAVEVHGGMGVILDNNAFLALTTLAGGSGGGVFIADSMVADIARAKMISLTGGSGGTIRGIRIELAEGVEVHDSAFTNFVGDDAYGVHAAESLDVYVNRCAFKGFYTDTATAAYYRDVSKVKVQDNMFENIGLYNTPANNTAWALRYEYTGASVSLFSVIDQIAIIDNRFFKAKNGIDLDFSLAGSPEAVVSTKYIQDNTMEGYVGNVSDKGIRANDANGLEVRGNSVKSHNTGVELLYTNVTSPDAYVRLNNLAGNVLDLLIAPPGGGAGAIRVFDNVMGGFSPAAPRSAPIVDIRNLTPSGGAP